MAVVAPVLVAGALEPEPGVVVVVGQSNQSQPISCYVSPHGHKNAAINTDLALALKLTLEPLEVAVSPANLGVLQLEHGQIGLSAQAGNNP